MHTRKIQLVTIHTLKVLDVSQAYIRVVHYISVQNRTGSWKAYALYAREMTSTMDDP